MADSGVAISGRLVEGETLKAWVLGNVTSLQWQALINGQWVNVGTANSQTYVIPAGFAGRSLRAVAVADGVSAQSVPTEPVTVDSRKGSAPVLSGEEFGVFGREHAGPSDVFYHLQLTDADRSSYGGGSLVVSSTATDGQDKFWFAGGPFQYQSATRELTYYGANGKGEVIATVDAVLQGNGTPLKFNFTQQASVAAVDALINQLTFSNDDDSPGLVRLLSIRVTDGSGASAQRVVSYAIQPLPDAPVFVSGTHFMIDENQTAVGSVLAADPDLEINPAQGMTYSLAPGAGAEDNALFAIDAATGALRFLQAPDYEAPNGDYQVRVRATDTEGSTSEQAVTVGVRNVNEAPNAQWAYFPAAEDGGPVMLQPYVWDQDANDQLHLSVVDTVEGALAADGLWLTFDPGTAYQWLGEGESSTEQFTYTVTDAAGLSATQQGMLVVDGRNDAASIGGVSNGSLLDAPGPTNPVTRVSGQLTVTDPDRNDGLLRSETGATALGTYVIEAGGAWHYDVYDPSLQALAAGQTAVERFTATSRDGTATQEIVVTLTGSNDAPELNGILFGMVAEDATATASGSLLVRDPDQGDTGYTLTGSATGQYGRFDVNATTGRWTYTLDDALPATDALGLLDWRRETFTVRATDAGGAWTERIVEIDVQGANDAPRNVQGTVSGQVVESAPDGQLVLANGAAQGEYALAVDRFGGLVLLGDFPQPEPTPDDWGGGPIAVQPGKWLFRLNADGSRDTGFGVRVDPGMDKLAIDSEGRYVLGRDGGLVSASESSSVTNFNFAAVRYLMDGTRDMGFGTNGTAIVDFGGTDDLEQMLALPDGKMLLVGSVTLGASNQLGLARLNDDGSLDTSYGIDGRQALVLPGMETGAWQVAADTAGGVLAWGTTTVEGTGEKLVHIARYGADGNIDTAYGSDGVSTFSLGSWYANVAADLVVGGDGNAILAWGTYHSTEPTGYRAMFTRFTADGAVDTTFGEDGTVDSGFNVAYGQDFDIALDAEGRILLTGRQSHVGQDLFMVARFRADGSIDPDFAGGGVLTTDLEGGVEKSHTVTVLPGNDILLAGSQMVEFENNTVAAFTRYNPDGTPELGFGGPPDDEAYGYLTASDPDSSSLAWSGSAQGTYGTFRMYSAGDWTYQLDNSRPATQALQEGQVVTESFTATVRDNWGGTATQAIEVTVVGSYDTPLLG